MAKEHVHGIAITFDTGFFASIKSVNGQDIRRGAINTSDAQTTTNMEFEPADLVDQGGVRIGGFFDPGLAPPIADAAESCVITFPTSGSTMTGSAFMTDFSWSGDHEDGEGLFEYEATLKWAGAVAIVDGDATGTGS